MPDRPFDERRKHPRYQVSLEVALSFAREMGEGGKGRRISGRGRNISGMTGDISFEGLLFKANPLHVDVSSLFEGTQSGRPTFSVDLEMKLDGKTIRAAAEIRWFKLWYTGQEPYQLEAGVFLKELDSESRKSWDEYFRKLKS